MEHLHTLDYIIIAAYFCVTAGIGIWVARGKKDKDDLFLAGRSLGPVAVGFSLYAANVSSDTLIGLPGGAYRNGISVGNYEWMAGLVLIFTAFFVLPVIMRSKVTTMPELMERRFDWRLRKYLSVITLLLAIVIDTAASLYAGSVVVTAFFPSLSMWEMSLVLAAFTAVYTASGGLRAVVYTDVMQAFVLLGGSIALAILVFGQFDFSWSQVMDRISPDKMSMIRPLGANGLPWLGTLIGLPIAGFYYWTMNQYVIQRVLGARDMSAAGGASVIAAGLKLLNPIFMVIPGALAIALLPNLEHPDKVFPEMIMHFAPVGLTGLLLAGLAAALMSSLSAVLNSSATLVTLDFIQPMKPNLSNRQLAWCGRVATFVIAGIAALWAPFIQHFQGLFNYIQQLFAYVASPLVAVFLFGLWNKKLGPSAALRGLICGHAVSALLFVGQMTKIIGWHYTISAGISCASTALITWAWMAKLGCADRPDEDDKRVALIARKGLTFIPPKVRWASFIVLGLTALLIIVLW
ncbi:sodium/solute symporter [Oleiagrimonas sp. C23AA]|nr:sodium/solute symporter [Oleiagrimonas sp. C23AA]